MPFQNTSNLTHGRLRSLITENWRLRSAILDVNAKSCVETSPNSVCPSSQALTYCRCAAHGCAVQRVLLERLQPFTS